MLVKFTGESDEVIIFMTNERESFWGVEDDSNQF
jgi:hypothetical protein